MQVIVNGENREILAEMNLAALLKVLQMPSERIAVELNQVVVRRASWDATTVKDGDKIEIVHFVGGG